MHRSRWKNGTGEVRKVSPPWLTEEQLNKIREFYAEAERRTRETGIEHNVDHVVPLGSPVICGLHVPWNLQVLTRVENSKKGTAF